MRILAYRHDKDQINVINIYSLNQHISTINILIKLNYQTIIRTEATYNDTEDTPSLFSSKPTNSGCGSDGYKESSLIQNSVQSLSPPRSGEAPPKEKSNISNINFSGLPTPHSILLEENSHRLAPTKISASLFWNHKVFG